MTKFKMFLYEAAVEVKFWIWHDSCIALAKLFTQQSPNNNFQLHPKIASNHEDLASAHHLYSYPFLEFTTSHQILYYFKTA